MQRFPEFLDFGGQLSNAIDNFFAWFKRVFAFLFTALRSIFMFSLNLIDDTLTKTPWVVFFITILLIAIHTFIRKFPTYGIVQKNAEKNPIKFITKISNKKFFNKKYIGALVGTAFFVLWIVLLTILQALGLSVVRTFVTPWWVFVILLFLGSLKLYDVLTASLLSGLLLLIGVFGLWTEMIATVSIVILAIIVSLIIGIPFGILMAKRKTVEKILTPLLDMMQTIPTFVYLIPSVIFFGIGRVPGVFATTIYAIPPLVRLTALGIKEVDKEMYEAGVSFGATNRQLLFKIELPQAIASIATGLNQTTMMAVAMVVTASMIGAPGLGQVILKSTNQLRIGAGFVGGFAIVALAIILDRLLHGLTRLFEQKEPEVEA